MSAALPPDIQGVGGIPSEVGFQRRWDSNAGGTPTQLLPLVSLYLAARRARAAGRTTSRVKSPAALACALAALPHIKVANITLVIRFLLT